MASYETLLRLLYHWRSPKCCGFQFPVICNNNNNNNNNNNMADVLICEAEVTI